MTAVQTSSAVAPSRTNMRAERNGAWVTAETRRAADSARGDVSPSYRRVGSCSLIRTSENPDDDLLRELPQVPAVVQDHPVVRDPQHPPADRGQPLLRLKDLQLLPTVEYALEGGPGIDIHQHLHVRHRQDAGDDPVCAGAQPVRQIGDGHAVPHEHHVVAYPAPPPAHDADGVQHVRHVQDRGHDHVQLRVPAEEGELQPADGGAPVRMGDDHDRPAPGLQLLPQDVGYGALPGAVHAVDHVPRHGIRAPAGPWSGPPRSESRCCRTVRGRPPPALWPPALRPRRRPRRARRGPSRRSGTVRTRTASRTAG